MYDANTLKILFRFSQIPINVYSLEWKLTLLPAFFMNQKLLRQRCWRK